MNREVTAEEQNSCWIHYLGNNSLPFLVHDLNNYLMVVNAHVAIARTRHDKIDKRLAKIDAGLHLISLLLRQAFPGGEAQENIETIDTAALRQAFAAMAQFLITDADIQYEITQHGQHVAIRFRWNTLLRVLSNLLTNAKEAMPSGGKITVKITHDLSDHVNGWRGESGMVVILLQDQGVGIPEENLPSIFLPGFSTKKRGSGLGLAFCRAAIEKNGGCLEVSSTPGAGTTFTIRLPAFPCCPSC
jgi:two-component system, cell cycle sensor histidine kinase and response regulator CckA